MKGNYYKRNYIQGTKVQDLFDIGRYYGQNHLLIDFVKTNFPNLSNLIG